MKIGIDLDGVLYPWQREVYRWVEQTTPNFNIPYNDFWVPHRRISFFGYDILDHAVDVEFLYTSGQQLHQHVERKLAELYLKCGSSNIHFITARPPAMKDATLYWMKKYRYLEEESQLLFNGSKAKICKELTLDYFIEDLPKNLIEIWKSTSTTPLGVKQPWNNHLWNGSIKMFYDVGGAITYIIGEI